MASLDMSVDLAASQGLSLDMAAASQGLSRGGAPTHVSDTQLPSQRPGPTHVSDSAAPAEPTLATQCSGAGAGRDGQAVSSPELSVEQVRPRALALCFLPGGCHHAASRAQP